LPGTWERSDKQDQQRTEAIDAARKTYSGRIERADDLMTIPVGEDVQVRRRSQGPN
jgi:hypothetical protein